MDHPNEASTVIAQSAILTSDDQIKSHFKRNFHLFHHACSINTQKAILRALKAYHYFCLHRKFTLFPLSEEKILHYINDRKQDNVLGRTIDADVSMLKMLDALGLNKKKSPLTDSKAISLALKAIKRPDRAKKKANAIDYDRLCEWYEMQKSQRDSLAFKRNNALFRIAYDGMLRVSEIRAIRILDIDIVTSSLCIQRSKTDQDAEGEFLYLRPETINAFNIWQEALNQPQHSPLFWSFFKGGKLKAPLSDRGLMKIIKEAFYFVEGVSSHSFRVGACEDMASNNISMTQIMLSGRWKDPKMPAYYSRRINAAKSGMAELALLQKNRD